METDKYFFFWTGVFSQWYLSEFEIDGIVYNCAEKYMMAKKALLFNDYESHTKIMATANPRTQKALGKLVKGFDKEVWETYCRDYVYDANYAKFTQNLNLQKILLTTGDKEIVEASPEDKIWGIGLRDTNPLAWDKSTWEGTNWLGEILVKVREKLCS